MACTHHRMAAFALLGLVAVATSCSDDKGKGQAASKEPLRPAKELFEGSKCSMPKPMAGVKLRAPLEEAKQAAPWLFAGKPGMAVKIEGYDNVQAGTELTDDKAFIRIAQVFLASSSIDDTRGFLSVIWGEPRKGSTRLGDAKYIWSNPEEGLRLSIEPTAKGGTNMLYEPMMSAAAFLGTEPGKFGFEKVPLLGATQADVKKAMAAWLGASDKPEQISFMLPPIDDSEKVNWAFANFKEGKVAELAVQLNLTAGGLTRQAILKGLEAKFGKPKKNAKEYDEYAGPPKVQVDAESEPDKLFIWIGA